MRGSGAKARRGVVAGLALLLLSVAAPPARPQGALSALETDVDQIARRGRPSVLTVFAQSVSPSDSTAHRRRIRTRVGSGVAVEDNVILTTASVVLGCNRVIVRTMNGIQVEARVLGLDPIFNVALLQAPELRLPPLRFAEERAASAGDWVIALGTSYRAQPTQSVGNIAFIYRDPRLPLLQLTNTVYPGNSGGAALNARGELVGLVQGELGTPALGANSPGGERPGGASFVLPAETVAPVYRALRRSGRVPHGFLGVTTRAYTVESVSEEGAQVPLGALVEAVRAGGPAARLGLQRGDLIVAFDRERVEYPEQLARWVSASAPGSTIELVWARKEIQHSGRVLLDDSPPGAQEWTPQREAAPAPTTDDPALSRIAELERQIRSLSRELDRLKGQRPASR